MCRGQALRNETGQFARMVGTHTDITQLKNAEAALRESETRFRQLTDNIQEVFWMSSADGRDMIYVSPAYDTIFGRDVESLRKAPGSWFDAVHPDDRERVRLALGTEENGQSCGPPSHRHWSRRRSAGIRLPPRTAYVPPRVQL